MATHRGGYSEKELLKSLHEYRVENGGAPSQQEYDEFADPHPQTVVNHFGSWEEALLAAGIDPDHIYTKAEILSKLKGLAKEKGRAPSLREFQREYEISESPINRIFDSWSDAVRAAGYEPQDARPLKEDRTKVTKYTREEMLEWLRLYLYEFGEVPKASELEGWPGPAPTTYRRRFGSFDKALLKAGIKPRGGA